MGQRFLQLAIGAILPTLLAAQPAETGRRLFESRCAHCHGADAKGGEFGASLMSKVTRPARELSTTIRTGLPNQGMPAFDFTDAEMTALVTYLRGLAPAGGGRSAQATVRVETTDGKSVEGIAVHQGMDDLQLRTPEGRVLLFRKSGTRYRAVTSQVDWTTYDGEYSGNRFSAVKQIDRTNVARLAPKWIFTMADTSPLETTPLVVDGLMYVTSANQCYALDAGTGRQIWHFQRPRSQGLVGNAVNGINRGVAVSGDRVFLSTDHAHLLALNRFTGAVLWETVVADWQQNYSITSAPLVVGDLVLTGNAGGDAGARGFVAAYEQSTGKQRWRFWTAPLPGEPGSETWKGTTIDHPAAATWFIGTYDPQAKITYWATGNPGSDHNGDERQGDNLYASSVVALDAVNGTLKWHYQFIPHDVWDWDSQEPLVLVDTEWQGRPRKLLIQANRNGFFYVLDRLTGQLLLTRQFVKEVTWASGIGTDGRPILVPGQEPSDQGTRVCPALLGATNWWSTAWNPATGLYYVQTLESCSIYTKRETEWQAGRVFMGGATRDSPGDPKQKVLRAIDIHTGEVLWELPQSGPGTTRGGVIATAGGLVFFCDDAETFMAVDSSNGKPLWRFPVNQFLRASPMTYVFDNHQMVAIAAGPNILAFGLPE